MATVGPKIPRKYSDVSVHVVCHCLTDLDTFNQLLSLVLNRDAFFDGSFTVLRNKSITVVTYFLQNYAHP